MTLVHKTPQAEQDIYEVLFPIALDNIEASAHFKSRLENLFSKVADNPEMGRSRPELGRDVRLFPFERRYLIIYRPITDGILVLRFLHSARDISEAL